MPIQYTPSKFAYYTDPEDIIVEQEHKADCDANVLVKKALSGQIISTKKTGGYGYDDLTMDAVRHRIMKEEINEELETVLSEEYSEDDAKKLLEVLPEQYKSRVKIKKSASDKPTGLGERSQELKGDKDAKPSDSDSSRTS